MNRSDGRAPQILAVEDNPADARLIEELLGSSRMLDRVHFVRDGEEAMDFLYRRGKYASAVVPDLILLDLNLPNKDGREVLREIKEDPILRKIPVLVLTSSDREEDISKSYEFHANCFITKPSDLDDFDAVLRSIENFWLTIAELPGPAEPPA